MNLDDMLALQLGDDSNVPKETPQMKLLLPASPFEADPTDSLDDDNDDATSLTLKSVDYGVRIENPADLQSFATFVKDAVVSEFSSAERFSSIRLRNADIKYNDYMCLKLPGTVGLSDGNSIEVRQHTNALQLAGTVVHELSHVLVGVKCNHNEDWIAGCNALGLLRVEASGQQYVISDFSTPLQKAITRAILLFARTHPKLVMTDHVIPVPDGMIPLPYQLEDVKEIMFHPTQTNWLNGNEMGTGKTVEALLCVNVVQQWCRENENRDARILITCPNSLRLNWQNEVRRWVTPSRSDVEQCTTQLYVPSDFVIASYEGTKKWLIAMSTNEDMTPRVWDLHIVDEAHYCKSPDAQRTRATFAIRARRKLYMTGTPIVNYPYEIFPLLHSLDSEVWAEAEPFMNRYSHPTNNKLGRNLTELQDRLRTGKGYHKSWNPATRRYDLETLIYDHRPIMIRRLKRDVLTMLPKKRRQVIEIPCDSTPEIKKLVQKEWELWNQMNDDDGSNITDEILKVINNTINEAGSTDEDLASIIEMLKPSRSFLFSEISRVRHKLAVAKIPLLKEHIDEWFEEANEDDKLVVFTHHNDVADALYNAYRSKHGCVRVTGLSTPVHERQMAVDRFQTDPSCRMFVGSMRAAGLGLTLTASHHVMFGELDWTPAVLSQCEDRCHRIGQDHPLLVQHLVVEKSMDAFMAKKVIAKQKSIKTALDRDAVRTNKQM